MSRLLLAAALALGLLTPAALLADGSGKTSRSGANMAGNPGEDEVVYIRGDDPAMLAAIAEAQRTLPEFLGVLAKPDPLITNIVFKYPLGGKEHIWVDHVARDGDYLTGRLANDPVQPGYTYQQEVRVKLIDISDWAYRNPEGIMQGHRTTRVLLRTAPAALRKEMLEDFGWK
jgi:uncharacterized protein YegJ (DUF2314 family)